MTNDTLIPFYGLAADRPAAPTYMTQGYFAWDTGEIWVAKNTAGVLSWQAAGGSTGTIYYQTVQDEGTPLTQRTAINFTGAGVSATDTGGVTTVTISGGGGSSVDRVFLQDQQASGTDGGTFTSGAWQTRLLNTEVVDTGGHCTLSSNQFTLAAGTWWIDANAPAFNVTFHKLRLRNITDASDTLIGTSAYSSVGQDMQTLALLTGQFTIAGSTTFELQHQCSVTQSGLGFGVASSYGVIEIYAQVTLLKLA